MLTFSNPLGHPPGAFGVNKYVVWNVREGLAEPGQWYLDRTAGKLVYWPLAGEDMNAALVVAPRVESILQLRGRPVQAAGPQPMETQQAAPFQDRVRRNLQLMAVLWLVYGILRLLNMFWIKTGMMPMGIYAPVTKPMKVPTIVLATP